MVRKVDMHSLADKAMSEFWRMELTCEHAVENVLLEANMLNAAAYGELIDDAVNAGMLDEKDAPKWSSWTVDERRRYVATLLVKRLRANRQIRREDNRRVKSKKKRTDERLTPTRTRRVRTTTRRMRRRDMKRR